MRNGLLASLLILVVGRLAIDQLLAKMGLGG